MTKLNLQIGRIDEGNNALLTGPISDIGKVTQRTASSVLNTVSPSALAILDNTVSLISNPKNIVTAENYGKLAKTFPAIPMDILMKAFRLPFSRLDDAVQYVFNNNLRRVTDGVQSLTTGFVANLLTNNGDRKNRFMNALGTGVEGFGDLVGSAVKFIPGGIGYATSKIDGFLAHGTNWTEGFVNSVRIQSPDKSFFSTKTVTPSLDTPAAANDNRAPVKGEEKKAA